MNAFRLALALAVSLFGFTACGGGAAEATGDGDGDGTSGGEAAAQYAGPVGSSDAVAGEEAYQAACAPCHEGGAGPALADLGWSAARVRQQVREGSGGMPPLDAGRVSDEDVEHILAHLQSIGAVQ